MILFYLLVTVLPLTLHPLWSRFIGDLTIIKYLGLACVIYAALELTSGGRTPMFLRTWQARLTFVFFALATVSFFTLTGRVAWETSVLMIYISMLMLFFATLTLVSSLDRLRWTLAATVGGLALASLYVLREFQSTYFAGIDRRPGYVVGDPNYFTISALLCVPVGLCLAHERRPQWARAYYLGCVVLILLAVTVAASRGGFLGLSAALFFTLWHLPNRLRNFAIILSLVLPLSLLSPVSPLQRLTNPTFSDVEATDSRYELWSAGVRMFQAHPITGVGVMNFKALAPRFQPPNSVVEALAHNTYVELAAEMGLFGFAAYWSVWIAALVSLRRARLQALRLRVPLLYHSAIGLQAGLIGYAVAAFFVSAQYQRLYWFVVFLSACLPPLLSRVARRRATTAQTKRLSPV